MSAAEQYTIEELRARYELEPSLQDVFVEGVFDREVLTRAFAQRFPDVSFYEIENVAVPAAVLKAYELTDGCKQRVIALARELSSLSGHPSYKCLVDRDLDHWYGELETTSRLYWTEYCAMELYFFNASLIRDILCTAAKARIADFNLFWDSLSTVLVELYLFRLVDRDLDWKMSWLESDKFLSVSCDRLAFDSATYIVRLLAKNKKTSQAASFNSRLELRKAGSIEDPRLAIRGHDFVSLMAWTVRKLKGTKGLADSESIERILILMADRCSDLLTIFPAT